MSENGVKTNTLFKAGMLDEVIGNRDGNTAVASIFVLSQQLLGAGPLADAIASGRDAAVLGGVIYSDEATGRAAVADGAYYTAESAVTGGYLDLFRRVDASSSTFVDTYPNKTAIDAALASTGLIQKAADAGDFALTNVTAAVTSNRLQLTLASGYGWALADEAYNRVTFKREAAPNGTYVRFVTLGYLADGTTMLVLDLVTSFGRVFSLTSGGTLATYSPDIPIGGQTAITDTDSVQITLRDGFYIFEIDRGTTGTFVPWLPSFRVADLVETPRLGFALITTGTRTVASDTLLAAAGYEGLKAQTEDNATNSAAVALGAARGLTAGDIAFSRGETARVVNETVRLGRGGDGIIPTVMLDPNIKRVEFKAGSGTFYGLVVGYNSGDGNVTMMGLSSLVGTVFDCSATTTLLNQTAVGSVGVIRWEDIPARVAINDDIRATIEDDDIVLFEYKRAAASLTAKIDPEATFTGSITPNGTTNGTLTVSDAGTAVLAVGSIVTGQGIFAGTRITALGTGTGGVGTYTVNIAQSVTSREMTVPPLLTVSAISTGSIGVGSVIATGAAADTTVTALGSGIGGTGTYSVDISQTVSSTAMTTEAQSDYLNGWRLNRKMEWATTAVNLTGWDVGLQLGFAHLAGGTAVEVARNVKVSRLKDVAINGYNRQGIDWQIASVGRDEMRGHPWQGKKALFVGDSITAADIYYRDGAPSVAARRLQLAQIYNRGYGGNTLVQLYSRIEDYETDADLIVVDAGVNDYLLTPFANSGTPFAQTPIGTPGVNALVTGTGSISGNTLTVSAGGPFQVGDFIVGKGIRALTKITAGSAGSWTVDGAAQTVASTAISAVRDTSSAILSLLDELGKRNRKAMIHVFSPTRIYGYTMGGSRDFDDGTLGATPLVDYADAVLAAGAVFGCPTHDFYRHGPRNRWNMQEHSYDGLHPNAAGHFYKGHMMAGRISG